MMPDSRRTDATHLADSLRAFHKTVIDAALAGAPDAHMSPFAQLTALMHDPEFAWLRPLSSLVANTDHVLRTTADLAEQAVRELRRAAEAVLGPNGGADAGELRRRIGSLTPTHPEVGIALAEVRHALARLPDA